MYSSLSTIMVTATIIVLSIALFNLALPLVVNERPPPQLNEVKEGVELIHLAIELACLTNSSCSTIIEVPEGSWINVSEQGISFSPKINVTRLPDPAGVLEQVEEGLIKYRVHMNSTLTLSQGTYYIEVLTLNSSAVALGAAKW